MKLYFILLFAVLLHSCADVARKEIETKTFEKNWQLSRQSVMKHTYNKYSLLDTTYEIQNFYVDGQIAETLNFFITRNYNSRKNLITEKTFHVLNKNKLLEVKRFAYDINNNVVEEVKLDDGVASTIKRIYNNLNQEIKKVQVAQGVDFDSLGNKKVQSRYDTSIVNTVYDKQGNVIRQLFSGSNENLIVESIVTQYSDGRKVLSYGINSKGDTTSVTKFEQAGAQLKGTREDKVYSFISDTSWYQGKNLTKQIIIDSKMNYRRMETYKYDEKGNIVENTIYK